MGKSNPEKIMLFLLPLVTVGLFLAAILIYWFTQNWLALKNAVNL